MMIGLISFISTCLVLEATPGPNMGYLTMITMTQGRRAGFALVLGVATGLFLIGILCMTGFGLLLGQSATAYEILRWLGGIYLFYLAWEAWQSHDFDSQQDHVQTHSAYRLFQRGLITNLLNPKAIIFYLTVLPEFVFPEQDVFHSRFILTVVYVAIATLVHSLLVLLAGSITKWVRKSHHQTWLRYGFTLALLLIAVWFIWTTQQSN